MPIYNTNKDYLTAAIQSILDQTEKDFEFLILNDSPENTELDALVQKFDDPRIKYTKNSKNLGISDSRNKLIEMAQGEYLAVMDHDDISLPERLAKEAAYLDNHHEVGVVSSFAVAFGKQKEAIEYPTEDQEIKCALTICNPIIHPAAMIRKSVLIDNHLRYENAFSPAEDYRLWCRMVDFTKFHNIPEVLFKWRIHDSNASKVQKLTMLLNTDKIRTELRSRHHNLYSAALSGAGSVCFFKLFGLLPLLKVVKTPSLTKISLFNRLPVLTIKHDIRLLNSKNL